MNSKFSTLLGIALSAAFASAHSFSGSGGIYQRAIPPGSAVPSSDATTPSAPSYAPDESLSTTGSISTTESTATTELITSEFTSAMATETSAHASTAYNYDHDTVEDYDDEVVHDYDAQIISEGQKMMAPNGDYYHVATDAYGFPDSLPIHGASAYGNPLPPLPPPVYGDAHHAGPISEPIPYGTPQGPIAPSMAPGPSVYGSPQPPLIPSYDTLDPKDDKTYTDMTHEYAKEDDEAEKEGDHAHEEGDHAHEEGDHAHEEGDHAHEEGDHAHEEGDHAHEEGDHVDHEYSKDTAIDNNENLYMSGSWTNQVSAGILLILAVF